MDENENAGMRMKRERRRESDVPRTTGTVACCLQRSPLRSHHHHLHHVVHSAPCPFCRFLFFFYYLLSFVLGERAAFEFGWVGAGMKSAALFVGDESTRSSRSSSNSLSSCRANALDLASDCDPTLFVSGDLWTRTPHKQDFIVDAQFA